MKIMKIKCLIVDDEELARLLLKNYIEKLPFLQLVGSCARPADAIDILQREKVDILFLDIQMPEMTGIELLNSLLVKPKIIFTTAYKEYALQGFNLDVIDYLLKPFRFERFTKAVNKCMLTIQSSQEQNQTLIPEKVIKDSHDYILAKSEFKMYKINYKDILYIESMSEYVAYHTNTRRVMSLGSLKALVLQLPDEMFIRVHKSYIINLKYMESMEGNMIYIGDKKIPVGGSFKEALKNKLF